MNKEEFEEVAAHLLLGLSPKKGWVDFVVAVLKSAKEGHLCLRGERPQDLPEGLLEEGNTLFPKTPLVFEKDRTYLQRNWVYETYLLEQVARLNQRKGSLLEGSLDAVIEQEHQLNEDQKRVVRHLFMHPFAIVSGGPGTGKTHTASIFVRLLAHRSEKRLRIIFTAPTGKAALHLQTAASRHLPSEVTHAALTLHRLLNIKPGETNLLTKRKVDADLVIVDEASMMDISLMAHLLGSIGEETRLVLLGDPNQLPPVEQTSLFPECNDLFGMKLTRSMRTEESLLHSAFDAILRGDESLFFDSVQMADFDEDLIDRLYAKLTPLMTKDPIDPAPLLLKERPLCLLNSLRQGPFGLEAVNRRILEKMDRDCKDGWWWMVPILVTANLPHLNLYNGTSGILIGQKKGQMRLDQGIAYFAGMEPFQDPPPYEVSFCLSIHKSQGSEFDEVVVLLPDGSESFGREALYTAATRAKKRWEIVGKKEIVTKLLASRARKETGFLERFRPISFLHDVSFSV